MTEAESTYYRKLEGIAALEYGPYEVLRIVREARSSDAGLMSRIGDVLVSAVWILLATRACMPDAREWHDALRQIAAYHPSLRSRVDFMAEFLLISSRIVALLQAGTISDGDPGTRLLAVIGEKGGSASVAEVETATGFTYGSVLLMSRTLAVEGRLAWKGYGKESVLSIPKSG